jgi:hypothetical protein
VGRSDCSVSSRDPRLVARKPLGPAGGFGFCCKTSQRELNGFPSWVDDLTAAHPAIVESVIGAELTAEIRLAVEHQHLSTLQDLAYSSVSMKRLLAPRLLTNLADWPSMFSDEDSRRRSAHHLEQVLQILDNSSEDPERATIAAICDTRFSTDLRSPLAPVWLQGLYRHDPERALEALDTALTSPLHADRSMLAVAAFSNLFGERNAFLDF